MKDYHRPWHVLNIDTSWSINNNFDFDKLQSTSDQSDQPVAMWYFKDSAMQKVLDAEWINYMASINLSIDYCLIFYRQPFYLCPTAHIDLHYNTQTPNVYGLNWVFSPDDDSYMTWYNAPIETGILGETPAKTKYVYWNMDEIKNKEISRRTLGNHLTLVRTDIAHNVLVNQQTRWSMSLRFIGEVEKNLHTWQDAVDYYHKYFE